MRTKKKTIALIAHDNKKHDMVNWALSHKDILANYSLCGTGTTAKLVAEATGLEVKGYLSGPMGGDLQIGAKMSEKQIKAYVEKLKVRAREVMRQEEKAWREKIAVSDGKSEAILPKTEQTTTKTVARSKSMVAPPVPKK